MELTVRPAAHSDLPAIRQILDEWLTDPATGERLPGESEARTALIVESLAGRRPDCSFVVADVGRDGVVGVGGLQDTSISPELIRPGERAIEVITTYVRRSYRGTGVGRAILDELEAQAVAGGYSTLLIVSGSRNRASGYPFWHRRYGAAVRWDDDYFGRGHERVVWRHELRSDRNAIATPRSRSVQAVGSTSPRGS